MQTMMMAFPRTMQIGQSMAASFFVNRRASGFKAAPPYVPQTNLVGSIVAEAAAQQPDNTELNSAFGNSVNFNSVVEVQYFDGYTVTNGVINLNAPVWRTMTQSVYEKARQEKANLLCRILAATKAMKMENLYALPEYDNMFILGDADQATSSTGTGTETDAWKSTYKAIRKQVKVDMKNVALNIGDPAANVDGCYIKSPVMIKRGKLNQTMLVRDGEETPPGAGSSDY